MTGGYADGPETGDTGGDRAIVAQADAQVEPPLRLLQSCLLVDNEIEHAHIEDEGAARRVEAHHPDGVEVARREFGAPLTGAERQRLRRRDAGNARRDDEDDGEQCRADHPWISISGNLPGVGRAL